MSIDEAINFKYTAEDLYNNFTVAELRGMANARGIELESRGEPRWNKRKLVEMIWAVVNPCRIWPKQQPKWTITTSCSMKNPKQPTAEEIAKSKDVFIVERSQVTECSIAKAMEQAKKSLPPDTARGIYFAEDGTKVPVAVAMRKVLTDNPRYHVKTLPHIVAKPGVHPVKIINDIFIDVNCFKGNEVYIKDILATPDKDTVTIRWCSTPERKECGRYIAVIQRLNFDHTIADWTAKMSQYTLFGSNEPDYALKVKMAWACRASHLFYEGERMTDAMFTILEIPEGYKFMTLRDFVLNVTDPSRPDIKRTVYNWMTNWTWGMAEDRYIESMVPDLIYLMYAIGFPPNPISPDTFGVLVDKSTTLKYRPVLLPTFREFVVVPDPMESPVIESELIVKRHEVFTLIKNRVTQAGLKVPSYSPSKHFLESIFGYNVENPKAVTLSGWFLFTPFWVGILGFSWGATGALMTAASNAMPTGGSFAAFWSAASTTLATLGVSLDSFSYMGLMIGDYLLKQYWLFFVLNGFWWVGAGLQIGNIGVAALEGALHIVMALFVGVKDKATAINFAKTLLSYPPQIVSVIWKFFAFAPTPKGPSEVVDIMNDTAAKASEIYRNVTGSVLNVTERAPSVKSFVEGATAIIDEFVTDIANKYPHLTFNTCMSIIAIITFSSAVFIRRRLDRRSIQKARDVLKNKAVYYSHARS